MGKDNTVNINLRNAKSRIIGYSKIINSLSMHAESEGILESEMLAKVINYLQNYKKDEYKKPEDLEFLVFDETMDQKIVKELISHLNKAKSNAYKSERKQRSEKKKKEKKEKEIERIKRINETWENIETELNDEILKSSDEKLVIEEFITRLKDNDSLDIDEKEFATKKLTDRLEAIKKDDDDKSKAEQLMIKINKIAKSEEENGIKTNVEIWENIKSMLIGENKSTEIQLEMSEKCEEYLSMLIDQKIEDEKDQVYFNQTKAFTNGFRFLGEYSELVKARHGHSDKRFTDKDAYYRFYRLRESVRRGNDEEEQINWLLKKGKIDSGDRRILEARKEVIEIEKAKTKAEGR